MASITLKGLYKNFGKVEVLKDLNLEIKEGEFVALLGPSGCGKTTTLLSIAGIYRPTKGEIWFGDKLVNDVLPKDRNIGMVFQSYALYPYMTVLENIIFPLRLQKKYSYEQMKERALRVARLVQIEEYMDRKPGQLSGGQQQRVALCRALVKEPDVLLLDEPLSNLDAKLRINMRGELKRLQKELGITTILVTHDQVEAMTMADRVAVMNKGVLRQYSTPDELYNKPKDTFVAGFIGSPPMNFLEAEIIEHGIRVLDDYEVSIPNALYSKIDKNQEIILGIRPEDIHIGKGIDVDIYVIEPLGKESLLTLKKNNHIFRALTLEKEGFEMGKKIKISFDPDKIHLFYKESGERVD